MFDGKPEWKATGGYTINGKNGIAQRQEDRACTLHFYRAEKGDKLHLLDGKYAYAVATYALKTDPKYIYTYDYQPEENWTEYRQDLEADNWSQKDYVFTEKVYFRVVFKNEAKRNGAFGLEEILQWRRAGEEGAEKTRENRLLEESSRTQESDSGLQEGEDKSQKEKDRSQKDKDKLQKEKDKLEEGKGKLQKGWGSTLEKAGGLQEERDNLREKSAGFWRSELQEDLRREGESTVQAVCDRQTKDSLNFLLMTDSHYTVNGTWRDTLYNLHMTVDALKEHGVKPDGFLHLGDATDGLVQAEVTGDYVKAMQKDIRELGLPLYYVLGNHDSNYFRNNPERFSEKEMRELYLPERERIYCRKQGQLPILECGARTAPFSRSEEHASDKLYYRNRFANPVIGHGMECTSSDKLYYYQDFPGKHLRMIFLDSFDPNESVRYGFHEEELDWLEDLLAQTPLDWYVLVFSHVPPTPRLHYWSKEIRGSSRLIRILRDFQKRSGADAIREKACGNGKHPKAGGKLLGFIHGHNHADQIDYEEGFPIIAIGCNKCEYFEDKKPEGAVTYKRALGTVSQDLWDVLVISTENGTMDFVRFGAGEDRHVSLREAEGHVVGELIGSYVAEQTEQSRECRPEGKGKQGCEARQDGKGKQSYEVRQDEKGKQSCEARQDEEGKQSRENRQDVQGKQRGENRQDRQDKQSGQCRQNGQCLSSSQALELQRTGKLPVMGKSDGSRREEMPMKRVITYGTFDLFHEGHYNILKRAKALGDYLIVGVTTEHYDEQRGKINIVDPLLERIENVRSTGLVDEIIIEDHEGQKIEDVQKYDIDIFTLGSDWKGTFDYLKAYCQVIYLERTPDISSTMLRKGKFPIIRMGVVGTGRIAPRFIAEAKFVSGLNVQSVYNPHRESADTFAAQHFLDAYSDSFESFLSGVDAIYIASPHETHYAYTRRALLAGKHVLCEKPMAFSRSQTEELFTLAKERQLILMEGIKTAYCPGFAQLISVAKSGKIGEIRDVEACFSRLTAPHLREMADAEYGGAFLEFGSYTVLPIVKLLGGKYERIKISSILAQNGVDLYTKIYFDYPEGMATSKTGVGVKSEGQLLISGTKGYILAESPWWLTRKFQVRYEDPTKIETYTPNFLGDGLRYEIGEFALRINGRGGHPFKLTEEETLAMAGGVEGFMEERGRQREEFRKKNWESGVRIWAHRGASYLYPENTLEAFRAACELPGLAGIELDIQLSRDGELIVFHDETLERLMDKTGNVRDYTLQELQGMHFRDWRAEMGREGSGGGFVGKKGGNTGTLCADTETELAQPHIPSMREVLELVRPYAQDRGVQINIELKNSRIPCEGMEEKILALVEEYGMKDFVVYSSFNGGSIKYLKELDGSVKTGILQSDIRDCLSLAEETRADALHPNVDSMTGKGAAGDVLERNEESGRIVRAWTGREPFYGQDRQYMVYDLGKLRHAGITDFITNVPEEYLESGRGKDSANGKPAYSEDGKLC